MNPANTLVCNQGILCYIKRCKGRAKPFRLRCERYQIPVSKEENRMVKTLYERLGGANGIARIVDDALDAHLNNPVVKTRYENIKDIEHTRKMAFEFFLRRIRRA